MSTHFWILLQQEIIQAVAVLATGTIMQTSQITTINKLAYRRSVSTGGTPLLPPNQQCQSQSTEGSLA